MTVCRYKNENKSYNVNAYTKYTIPLHAASLTSPHSVVYDHHFPVRYPLHNVFLVTIHTEMYTIFSVFTTHKAS